MRVTRKGQVTIPKSVRDKLGIEPGTEVGFSEEGQVIVLQPRSSDEDRRAAEHMVRHMKEYGRRAKRIPMTSDELMELTRGPFDDLNAD